MKKLKVFTSCQLLLSASKKNCSYILMSHSFNIT